ncbi:MAG: YceH family protein [Bryobacteraceae bacterium]
MIEALTPSEVRVLGSLIEKEATTPEYYPLSLNALVNACNQKSNRDPVVDFDEETVLTALERLRALGLAFIITGGRVTKYSQRISETLNLGRRELAVLCTLFLRGPQTLGEIKDRSERMFAFGDLSEVESVLDRLAEWPGGTLATKLPKQPGQKEIRFAHLLAGEPSFEPGTGGTTSSPPSPSAPRMVQLEIDLQQLRAEFQELRERFEQLEAQLK